MGEPSGIDFSSDPGARAEAAAQAARERALASWRRYLAVLAALGVALGGFVFRVVQTSEVRAVSIQTSAIAPSLVPVGELAAGPKQLWTTSDEVVGGTPLLKDVLATSSERSVAGRDVRTGSIRWQYTRRDRVLCDASSDGSVVMAIYAHDGLCDEISALDAGSGRRVRTRTLIGSATRAQLAISSIPGFLLVVMPDSVELLSPSTGLDYWVYQQKAGCVTVSAVLGTGVAAKIKHNAVQGQVLMTTRCQQESALSLLAGYVPSAVPPLGPRSGPRLTVAKAPWPSTGRLTY